MSRQRSRQRARRQSSTGLPIASLLLLGLIVGVGIGLYYAWVIDPVVYRDASPASFSEGERAEYIYLVSQSYAADGNLERARQRLAVFGEAAVSETAETTAVETTGEQRATTQGNDVEQMIAALLEQFLREQRSPEAIRTVATLAQDLGVASNAVALFAPPATVMATATVTTTVAEAAMATPLPRATNTPLPTPSNTPPPTPLATATTQLTYRLLSQEQLCLEDEAAPLIVVLARDALLEPLPGVAVQVQWAEGDDRFFTGFKPEQGTGYGDFTMTAGVSYAVTLVEGSPEISGLQIETCPETGLAGGWQLTFQNLIVR